MGEILQNIKLGKFPAKNSKFSIDSNTIFDFFENAFQSGTEIQECNEFLSILLERCCNENCLDSLYPVITDVAQKIQEENFNRLPKNYTLQSIH